MVPNHHAIVVYRVEQKKITFNKTSERLNGFEWNS
jgi:hypothetical protein